MQFANKLYSKLNFFQRTGKFILQMICGLINSRNVTLIEIAKEINGKANLQSKLRRIQRVLLKNICILPLIPEMLKALDMETNIHLTIDRTNWKYGKTNYNLLTIGLIVGNNSIPIAVYDLDRDGNSDQGMRIELIDKILKYIPIKNIKSIVGDREFIGKKWFKFLQETGIPFVMRIKSNTILIDEQGIKITANELVKDKQFTKYGRYKIDDTFVRISGSIKESSEDKLILASYNIQNPISYYKRRWNIESLFQNLKSRGFNLENTHITNQIRFNSLICFLAISILLCLKVGIQQNNIKPIAIKKHGRPQNSIFRYGLDYLQNHLKYCVKPLFTSLLNLLDDVFIFGKMA